MKWNILHESRGRIRLHLRKPRMSLAEADQLQDYLTNLEKVLAQKREIISFTRREEP